LWLCFELVFIGRLSPNRTPRKAKSDPVGGAVLVVGFFGPLGQAEDPVPPKDRAGCAAADPGERFFGYFLVATRKYLAFGCENPIRIIAG
jgi:hypothetical protein